MCIQKWDSMLCETCGEFTSPRFSLTIELCETVKKSKEKPGSCGNLTHEEKAYTTVYMCDPCRGLKWMREQDAKRARCMAFEERRRRGFKYTGSSAFVVPDLTPLKSSTAVKTL
ncbi:hypothetical protein F4774DRAFT_412263 [Daldinia eschscholtzii]|nr:hypothetical protein F4774DRAFT_412263 [Daldinia eschscholtzii]